MKKNFWQERWNNKQIGFHQPLYNPNMQLYFSKVNGKNQTILIPLMGKSKDLLFLLSQGFTVVGVEFIEQAILEFFEENKIKYKTEKIKGFVKYTSSTTPLIIYCGDFFNFGKLNHSAFDYIYDRAALIALPPEKRITYSKVIHQLSKPATIQLLITLIYNQQEMNGPPFSVKDAEVHKIYADWNIKQLKHNTSALDETNFKSRGLSKLEEISYELTKF